MEESINNITALLTDVSLSTLTLNSTTSTGPTTKSPAFIEYMKYYNLTRNLKQTYLGYVMTAICIIGVIANILNIVALTQIIKKSKLPVYRCFLGLAVADLLVRIVFFLFIYLLFL